MKFCQICGRPLNDGEVCNCQAQQAAPQQPQYQQAPYQQAPQQPYGRPAPAADGKFVKALKNIPVAFVSFFKNSDKVVATAKAKKDVILPALYVAIFFLVNLIFSLCFFARMTTSNYWKGLGVLRYVFGSINNFNFGYVLLAAFIMTVVVCFTYVLVRCTAQVIFAKKAPLAALIDSFIEFGFYVIPVICCVLLATLLGLATSWLVAPFFGLAAAYLVLMYVKNTLEDAKGFSNKLVVTCVMAFSIMVAIAFVFWMMTLVCDMNYNFYPKSSGIDYSGIDYSDIDLDDLSDLANSLSQYSGYGF